MFPASSLGKESDINQGLTLGTVDMIISGPSFAARTYPADLAFVAAESQRLRNQDSTPPGPAAT